MVSKAIGKVCFVCWGRGHCDGGELGTATSSCAPRYVASRCLQHQAASQPSFGVTTSLSCYCSEGVYRDRRCSLKPSELNHAVMLVGWGTDKFTNEPYWIVKNSE
jgi:hypothetical protein